MSLACAIACVVPSLVATRQGVPGGHEGGQGTAAVIVTTPQDVAVIDVRKEVSFCRKVGVPVLGIVENMAGLVTPLERCTFTTTITTTTGAEADVTAQVLTLLSERFPGVSLRVGTEVFRAGGGAERLCADMGVELLGRVPLDPALGAAGDAGLAVVGGEEALADGAGVKSYACLPALMAIVDKLVERTGGKVGEGQHAQA